MCAQLELDELGIYETAENAGDPDRIRTCDPQIRNLMLYPAELRDRRLRI